MVGALVTVFEGAQDYARDCFKRLFFISTRNRAGRGEKQLQVVNREIGYAGRLWPPPPVAPWIFHGRGGSGLYILPGSKSAKDFV